MFCRSKEEFACDALAIFIFRFASCLLTQRALQRGILRFLKNFGTATRHSSKLIIHASPYFPLLIHLPVARPARPGRCARLGDLRHFPVLPAPHAWKHIEEVRDIIRENNE